MIIAHWRKAVIKSLSFNQVQSVLNKNNNASQTPSLAGGLWTINEPKPLTNDGTAIPLEFRKEGGKITKYDAGYGTEYNVCYTTPDGYKVTVSEGMNGCYTLRLKTPNGGSRRISVPGGIGYGLFSDPLLKQLTEKLPKISDEQKHRLEQIKIEHRERVLFVGDTMYNKFGEKITPEYSQKRVEIYKAKIAELKNEIDNPEVYEEKKVKSKPDKFSMLDYVRERIALRGKFGMGRTYNMALKDLMYKTFGAMDDTPLNEKPKWTSDFSIIG